jgi:hypothetical protein
VAGWVKGILLILGVLLCAILLYFAYIYRDFKLQSAAANRARAKLEVTYQAQLAQYQHDLPIGVPRSEVTKYLESRKIVYRERRRELAVNLGEQPDVFPCDRWAVYVCISEFSQDQPGSDPSPQDLLTATSMKRIGHCL